MGKFYLEYCTRKISFTYVLSDVASNQYELVFLITEVTAGVGNSLGAQAHLCT